MLVVLLWLCRDGGAGDDGGNDDDDDRGHVIAMLLPRYFHAIAMLLPC